MYRERRKRGQKTTDKQSSKTEVAYDSDVSGGVQGK